MCGGGGDGGGGGGDGVGGPGSDAGAIGQGEGAAAVGPGPGEAGSSPPTPDLGLFNNPDPPQADIPSLPAVEVSFTNPDLAQTLADMIANGEPMSSEDDIQVAGLVEALALISKGITVGKAFGSVVNAIGQAFGDPSAGGPGSAAGAIGQGQGAAGETATGSGGSPGPGGIGGTTGPGGPGPGDIGGPSGGPGPGGPNDEVLTPTPTPTPVEPVRPPRPAPQYGTPFYPNYGPSQDARMMGLLGAVRPYANSGLARFGVGLGAPPTLYTPQSTFFGAQLPNNGGG